MQNFAVIFDMDGVIVDTNPYHLIAWREFLKRYNIEVTDESLRKNMFGSFNSTILKFYFERELSPEEIAALGFEKEALFREIYEAEAVPMNGLMPFLEDLKKHGVKTGIATSAPFENLELTLRKIPLADKMESMLSERDVLRHKPNPDVYLKSAENLGMPPERCIVFEDSVSGVKAGLAAGAKVVGVLSTYTKEELPPCDAYIIDYQGLTIDFVKNLMRK